MKSTKVRRLIRCLLLLLLVIGGGEWLLRHYMGMCHAPLYEESKSYEYIVRPLQEGQRFGKRFHYNSYSQRSEEPDSTKKRVLGLGDSVLFGGASTDQDSLATSLFTAETGVQMLNISSGSWGPDNCAAYLKEKGLFGARAMFLLVSSHDAHDIMTFRPVVGRHPNYPKEQYASAWAELFVRYIYPRTLGRWLPQDGESDDPDQAVAKSIDGENIDKRGAGFNPGFAQLREMAQQAGIPLYVYLHADLQECKSHAYNAQGQEIIRWCRETNTPLILELNEGITPDMYRDGIHINERGQRMVANVMKRYIHV